MIATPHPALARAALRRRSHSRALLAVAAALVAVAVALFAVESAIGQPASDSHARPTANGAGRGAERAARRATPARATDSSTVTIEREVFSYASEGRRDPFKSLLTTSDLRPLLAELRLVAVAVDPAGQNGVAILRDLTTKAQHRVRVGQLLGRMRVSQIRPRAVVFTVEELGFSRQEILALTDSSAARSK